MIRKAKPIIMPTSPAVPIAHFGRKLTITLIIFQCVFLFIYLLYVSHSTEHDGEVTPEQKTASNAAFYGMFQDIHVMLFIGFGFLMTFLKKYGYSSVGFNFVIGAFAIQWATMVRGTILHYKLGQFTVDLTQIISAEFATVSVLISFGAVLGRTSPVQLIIMTVLEVFVYEANEYIGSRLIGAVDIGSSVNVHVFGAYFGLAVSFFLSPNRRNNPVDNLNCESIYHSDIFSMIGTVFLWLFWPSFNSALAPGDTQHRIVMNTYYSLATCCVIAFAVSSAVDKEAKLNMVHIQNATLAGGVAIGTPCALMLQPHWAMLIGGVGGFISTAAFTYVSPFLTAKGIQDTCGVHNLHGLPGVLSGIIGIVSVGIANRETYGLGLYTMFPRMSPREDSLDMKTLQEMVTIEPGDGLTGLEQAGLQLMSLIATLAIAIVFGSLTGLFLRIPCLDPVPRYDQYSDQSYWKVPDDFLVEDHLVVKLMESPYKFRHQSEGSPEITSVHDILSGRRQSLDSIIISRRHSLDPGLASSARRHGEFESRKLEIHMQSKSFDESVPGLDNLGYQLESHV